MGSYVFHYQNPTSGTMVEGRAFNIELCVFDFK